MADEELRRARKKFVEKVSEPVIIQLLDDLFDDEVLNDGEVNSIRQKNACADDKARALIDTVRRKGKSASRKMIDHLLCRDAELHSELSLSVGQPAQPEPPREQEPPTTLGIELGPKKQDKDSIYPVTKDSFKSRVALLITNIKFRHLTYRKGAEKDEENMEKLLTTLGYEVVKYTNLWGKEIDNALTDFSKHPKLKDTDSVVVVVMSHGKRGTICGIDWKKDDKEPDEFPIDNIFKHLGSESCPALLDKPKVIIIQACRGGDTSLSQTLTKQIMY
ncbi:caspase a-like isoform X1 [Xyrichtys novacula]|uniref:Caspase a-like isoform X1 n=1 Tax=Xyrichtys novacula TaxID=13765 RepID=A0AAV1FWQ8_XYRNO|nr:caspase a-like isoform X1 [Xyrichtys novacula]